MLNLIRVFRSPLTTSCVCTVYQEKRGVPALFARCYFDRLQALSGNCGAKQILRELKEDIIELRIPEAGLDVDTPEDLLRLEFAT